MNQKLERLFAEYDQYHLHPVNRLTHKVGIPLIFFNALAMLDWVKLVPAAELPTGYLTVAPLVIVACGIWYLSMSIKLGLVMVVSFAALWAVGWIAPAWLVLAAGVAGWVVQLLGHIVWEKKAPNFTSNAIQSLVGPIYFAALATGDWAVPGAAGRASNPLRQQET